MEKENIKKLEDCFEWLDSLDIGDKDSWLKMDENKAMSLAHHGFGTMIRNELKLWNDGSIVSFFNKHGIYHADDMSGIILTSYHRMKNGFGIKLKNQIKKYIKYWNKVNPDVNKGKY